MDLLLCSYFGLFMLFTSYLYRSRVRIREIVSYFFLQVSGSGASAGLAQGWPGATVSGTAAGGPGGGERGHLLYPRLHPDAEQQEAGVRLDAQRGQLAGREGRGADDPG